MRIHSTRGQIHYCTRTWIKHEVISTLAHTVIGANFFVFWGGLCSKNTISYYTVLCHITVERLQITHIQVLFLSFQSHATALSPQTKLETHMCTHCHRRTRAFWTTTNTLTHRGNRCTLTARTTTRHSRAGLVSKNGGGGNGWGKNNPLWPSQAI